MVFTEKSLSLKDINYRVTTLSGLMKLWRIGLVVVALMSLMDGWAQSFNHFEAMERPNKRMEMGISVGVTYMGMSAAGVELQPKLGMRGALMMSLCWYEQVALQIELAYLYNKIEAKSPKSTFDVKSNVMEIPLMFSYRGVWPLRFNVGPVLSLAGTGRYSTGQEKVEFGRLRTTVGYTAGIGVNLSDSVVVDARFTGNFGRTDNYFEGAEFPSSSYWVGLNIGYVF